MFLPTDITLSPGDSGEFVAEMQRRMVGRDLLGQGNVSGVFDGPTEQAIKTLQAQNGLRQTGIAHPPTLRALSGAAPLASSQEEQEQSDSQDITEENYHYQRQMQEQSLAEGGGDGDYESDEERDREDQEREQELTQKKEMIKNLEHGVAPGIAAQQHHAERENALREEIEEALEDAQQVPQGKAELEVTQQGLEAKTLTDTLDEKVIGGTEETQAAHLEEKAAQAAKEPENAELKQAQEQPETQYERDQNQSHIAEQQQELEGSTVPEKDAERAISEERSAVRDAPQPAMENAEIRNLEPEIIAQDITPDDVAQAKEPSIEDDKSAQLNIDQQGMEAKTMQHELEELEGLPGQEHAAAGAGVSMLDDAIMQEALVDTGVPDATMDQGLAPASPEQAVFEPTQDSQLAATERQLDAPSVHESRSTGQHLDGQGVQQGVDVPQSQLGELVPPATPSVGRTQEQGMGV